MNHIIIPFIDYFQLIKVFLLVFETLKANSGKIEEPHSSSFRDQLKIGPKYIINYD